MFAGKYKNGIPLHRAGKSIILGLHRAGKSIILGL